ncbi:Uncharacterised protein [Bordetella pertussis]|nr:Uncharacterised protein [Bordetella pertussis]
MASFSTTRWTRRSGQAARASRASPASQSVRPMACTASSRRPSKRYFRSQYSALSMK